MNKFVSFMILFLAFTLIFAGPAGLDKGTPGKKAPVRQAFMEKSPGRFNPAEYRKNQQELFDWLAAESAPMSLDSLITIGVTEEDLAAIDNYRCESCNGELPDTRKVRIGVVKPAGVSVDMRTLDRGMRSGTSAISNGMMQAAPEGGYVWTTVIESPGASALRVHFSDVSLAPNAQLYVYNLDGEAFGPYTADNTGEFWSNSVAGPVAFVQVRHFGTPSLSDLRSTHFQIADIGYLGKKHLLPLLQQLKNPEGDLSGAEHHCSDNAPCIEDASCYSGAAIDNAKLAVAHMEWISGAWIYYCSGGLLADSDGSTQIPYFLTANHCISKGKPARSLECFWGFRTASCHGSCDGIGPVPRTLGADVLSANSTADYSFLQLWEDPPAGSFFLGWTTADAANNDGLELFRISYPLGMPQAYSEHVVDTSAPTCSSWPRGAWIYSRDTLGATEGGSSGSPVMNMNGQVVGQLSGACGANVYDVCDNVNNATVDGAFAHYFFEIDQWLGGIIFDGLTHIYSITLNTKRKGPRTDAIATVYVHDESHNPVAGAEVFGAFSGDASGSASGTTDSSGKATIKVTVQGSITSFAFCVDNIVFSGYTYDPAANHVPSCATY
jgi:hypothetical protein